MRILKDSEHMHVCAKCKGTDFWFMKKGTQVGIYCTDCGRWLKWADKDEQHLYEMATQSKGGNPDDL